MKTIVPNYYKKFKCIADHCAHNCCIGWEIDIDSDTLAFYQALSSPLGEKLRKSICLNQPPHFILGPQDRCPFLTKSNLCELITEFGDTGLCQICADHPRFFNEFTDRIEIGLGLCCEAAGRLILDQTEKTKFLTLNGKEHCTKDEQNFFDLRDHILSILQDRAIPFIQRIQKMRDYCQCSIGIQPLSYWAEIYRNLERLDPAWNAYIERFTDDLSFSEKWEIAYEQLAVYLVYRHLSASLKDHLLKERIHFIILTLQIICCLTARAKSIDEIVEVARLYSAEIEYSDQNIDTLLSLLK